MTQPIDPYNPPNMGLGLRAGMFDGAISCPDCGFATSDVNLFDCPGCGRVWRERPKPIEVVQAGPQAGEAVSLVCIICQKGPEAGAMAFAGGTDLAHKSCLTVPAASDEPVIAPELDSFMQVVQSSPSQKKKRKRKRRRKPAGQRQQPSNAEAPVSH